MDFGQLFSDTGKKFINEVINLVIFSLVGLILNFTIILIPTVTAGFFREFLNYARHGKRPEFKELFNFSGYLRLILLFIIGGIIVVIGYILFIIPGLILSIWWMYSIFFIVDKDMGFWEAMCASKRAVSASGFINHFAIFLVLIILNIIGSFIAVVGSLITTPFGMLLLAQVFIDHLENKA